jgi:C-terminal processing protease CtpA/Prc
MHRNIFFKKSFAIYALGPAFWGRMMPSNLNSLKFNYNENNYLRLDTFKEFTIEKRRFRYNFNQNNLNFLIKNMGMALSTFLFCMTIFKNKKAKCQGTSKPYLGCSLRCRDDGLQIVMVKSDSPAEKAGIHVKDVILEIDGVKVTSMNEYNAAIGSEANKKKLKILRVINDKEIILYVDVDFVNQY